VSGVEPEGAAGDQPDLGVERLDASIGDAVQQRGLDVGAVVRDGPGQCHEGIDAAAPPPPEPALSVGDKKRINESEVFVRHGSQTARADADELTALEEERDWALRSERGATVDDPYEFDTVEWPRLIFGNGPPVVHARPTLPTSDGRLEVGCAGEERRWICSKRYAASTSSA
jgi:hypothetical protein